MEAIAFVGDVHGELRAVHAIVEVLRRRGAQKLVFLGDYINKGPSSRAVIDALMELSTSGYALCLRGNHETAMLDCLDTGDVRPLLRMSGAPTIRSYVGRDVGADVASEFSRAVPQSHVEFLQSLPDSCESAAYFASHAPKGGTAKFAVSAHVNVGSEPRISSLGASIDTGCGSPAGLLTGLLWPALDYVQVDGSGRLVRSTGATGG